MNTKFKVGDMVECVMGPSRGAGWELGLKFQIRHISLGNPGNSVCWKVIGKNGVFEDSLKLVGITNWRKELCN